MYVTSRELEITWSLTVECFVAGLPGRLYIAQNVTSNDPFLFCVWTTGGSLEHVCYSVVQNFDVLLIVEPQFNEMRVKNQLPKKRRDLIFTVSVIPWDGTDGSF